MKITGYIRVSTEEQANSGISLEAQKAKIRGYAELYELDLVEIIEDRGASGKNLKRDGIQKALEMIRNGESQGILVAKLDRLTRSIVDMNNLIKNYFGEHSDHQGTLFSVADQVDTRTASGRLVLNVLMSVAQWERETIGERTKEALAHKKAKGERLGTPAMGTRIIDGKAVEDHEEIRTLRYIVELRESGLSLRAIARRLNDERITTKRGKKWKAQSVKNALKVARKVI